MGMILDERDILFFSSKRLFEFFGPMLLYKNSLYILLTQVCLLFGLLISGTDSSLCPANHSFIWICPLVIAGFPYKIQENQRVQEQSLNQWKTGFDHYQSRGGKVFCWITKLKNMEGTWPEVAEFRYQNNYAHSCHFSPSLSLSFSLQNPISQLFFLCVGFSLKQFSPPGGRYGPWQLYAFMISSAHILWKFKKAHFPLVSYGLHTHNVLTLHSVHVQSWTSHLAWGFGKLWRPWVVKPVAMWLTGWETGNSLMKRVLGRQKEVVCLTILLFSG